MLSMIQILGDSSFPLEVENLVVVCASLGLFFLAKLQNSRKVLLILNPKLVEKEKT